ncbi:MAG: MBL fold metallo-hydrolase [Beijerinckiaceae bacterium]
MTTGASSDEKLHTVALNVTLWGVRGSLPAPGAGSLAFGGDTICVEVSHEGRSLIVDAGTGLRSLGLARSDTRCRTYDLLLTHWHLDHLLGLMSFAPLYDPTAQVTLHAPVIDDRDPAFILDQIFGPPFHPVRIWEAGAQVRVLPFFPGATFSIGRTNVRTATLSHPGGACGYRFDAEGAAVVVLIDHEHGASEIDARLIEFSAKADLLLYDAHYDEDSDYAAHRGWGHSTWQAGEALRSAAGIGHLRCIHHHPAASDDLLAEREGRLMSRHPGSSFGRAGENIALRRMATPKAAWFRQQS